MGQETLAHPTTIKLCQKLNRHFTQEEWRRFFGEMESEKTGPGGGVRGWVVRQGQRIEK